MCTLSRQEESEIFNRMAEYYDKYRPSYPHEIIDAIIHSLRLTSGFSEGRRILEIGCGSGKATEQLIGNGFEILGLDPGRELIEKGKARFKGENVKLVASRLEDFPVQTNYFDAVLSAQAFHWVSKPLGYEICSAALKRGGYLMIFWNIELIEDTPHDDEFYKIIHKYNAYISTMKGEDYYKKRVPAISGEIAQSGFFEKPEILQVYWEKTYTAKEYFGYCMTGNVFIQNTEEVKHSCYRELSNFSQKHGGIKRRYVCELYTARCLK